MTDPRFEEIRAAVRKRYDSVARSPKPPFRYPTGREGLLKLGYGKPFVDSLPAAVADSFCGVGNPFRAGEIHPGEAVLDAGCGAGVDMLFAAGRVGLSGKVCGVDLAASMVEMAKRNIGEMKLLNVRAKEAPIESLPFPDGAFDVVISNGVLNLSPEKEECFAEIHRVLRPGGRLYLADMIMEGEVDGESSCDLDAWSG